MFHATLIIMSRKYFFGFQNPDWRVPFNVRQCPLMNQKTRLLSYRIQKRTGHRRTMVPLCYAISEGRPPLCNTSPSKSANVRPSPPMSVLVRQCPSLSVNVRPCPPIPSETANVRQCPPMSQKTRPLSHRIQKGQDIGGHRRT